MSSAHVPEQHSDRESGAGSGPGAPVRTRRSVGPVALVALVILSLVGVGSLGVVAARSLFGWGTTTTTTDSRVVQSIKLEQKVVLMSLGIQGIEETNRSSHIGNWTVPGTGKDLFLQYSYTAQLGVDGSDVEIDKTGDKAYTITVPSFEFLGYENPSFKTAVEDGGVISLVTPDIDTADAITEILTASAKEQHITDNEALLKQQCETFYTGIIHAIDPDIAVTFKYAPSASGTGTAETRAPATDAS